MEKTTDISENEKQYFLESLSEESVIIPSLLSETRAWKKLPATAKEIYRVLVSYYDYQEGISKVPQQEIQSASGIGSRVTIVKAIKDLNEKEIIKIVEIQTKNKLVKYHYLLPYQEKFYSSFTGLPFRDLSKVHKSDVLRSKSKTNATLPEETSPLFYRVCEKLSALKIKNPHTLIGKYANDEENLRTLMFMSDATHIVHKYKIPNEGEAITNTVSYLVSKIKNNEISEDIYGKEAKEKVKAVIKEKVSSAKKKAVK